MITLLYLVVAGIATVFFTGSILTLLHQEFGRIEPIDRVAAAVWGLVMGIIWPIGLVLTVLYLVVARQEQQKS